MFGRSNITPQVYRFIMVGSTGKTVRYEAYLDKSGKLVDLTNLSYKKPRRLTSTQGKVVYNAHKKGITSLEEAYRKKAKPRPGQPRTVKHQIDRHIKLGEPGRLYNRVLRSIGAARGEYDNGKWSYGGYKKAQAIYRGFRDVFSKDAWDNPNNQRIKPLHKCYSHSARLLYACVVVDTEMSPKLGEDGKPIQQSKKLYISYLDIYYKDACKTVYKTDAEMENAFHHYEEEMHKLPAVIDWEAQNIGVEFVGLCGYNVRLD